MFLLYADKNRLTVQQQEQVTSGSAEVYQALFKFSADWADLEKTACFRSGTQTISVQLDESGMCTVPWEVTDLDDKGKHLMAGVYGTRDGGVVLPTVWADCGMIWEGTSLGSNARPPTPSLLNQALAGKADDIQVEGQELRLMAGGKTLASVTLPEAGLTADEIATDTEMEEMLDEVFAASRDNI